MRWCAAGFEGALDGLIDLLRATPWPGPPSGFEALTPARPMRAVVRGDLEGPAGPVPVVLKWSRPATTTDHVSRRVRGGKGPREGRVLRVLQSRGVDAPRPLAYTDHGVDLLVTAAVSDLRPAPHPDRATREEIRAAARLVAAAHMVGLRHRDLHRGNLGFSHQRALLVDLGGARFGRPPSARRLTRALARLRHGMLGGARRSQRLRALVAYTEAACGGLGREVARKIAGDVERTAERVARRYRRGRDRRATRDGRHFATFTAPGVPLAIRWRDGTDDTWAQRSAAWATGEVGDAVALKAGGGVLRTEIDARPVVVKRFGPTAKGRLPRPLRAFRRAWALEHRHLRVPRALAAAATRDGAGVCVSEWVEAPNLHGFCEGGHGGAFAALPATDRHRSLERLGRDLRAMHDACVSHRDLKAPNLLARAAEEGFDTLLADLEGVRIRRRSVPWSRRARDLARLDASLDALATDRLRVLRSYMRLLPHPPVTTRQMAARIAVHVRRKRGPEGRPK